MRRLMFLVALLAVLAAVLLPTTVAADDNCCDYPIGSCCHRQCCAEMTYWFKVSYFERVLTGYFYHGVEMTMGIWTHQYVEAHNHVDAAEQLGFEGGWGCFISHAVGYEG